MSQDIKICPICGTPSHRNAALCSTCGTSLTDVEVVAQTPPTPRQPDYDRRFGETDLLEGELHRRSELVLFSVLLVIAAVACVGVIGFMGLRWLAQSAAPVLPTPTSGATLPAVIIATNTLPPAPVMATVTPPPPTPTPTATPGPCTHKVIPGDDLISIIWGCGYRTLDVLPTVLELNKLSSPEMIQVGQEIMVPWPTPTPDPNGAAQNPSDTTLVSNPNIPLSILALMTPTDITVPGLAIVELPTLGPPTTVPSPTLLPGVMWHTVKANENIGTIAYAFNTSLETLSQLNPEITFSQCDFGKPTGGDTCTVLIQPGQQVRVPAPTPTATLSPTFSGSETATPTLTPTFNAPSPLSPADRSLFAHNELVTLRWVGSGTLNDGETYRVQVNDLTSGQNYSSDTTDLSFILPADWQGQDGKRHDYSWTISVIRLDNPDHPYFTTEPRLFTWEGR